MREWLADKLPDRDVPAARALRRDVSLEAIEAAVCRTFAVEPDVLHGRRRWGNVARLVAIYLCRKLTGAPTALLGQRYGGVSGAAVSKARARLSERLGRDRRLARQVRACE